MNKTPKLRFKEFSDGLKVSKGNELFTILGGAAFSSKDAKCDGIKWFKIANVGINTTDKREISYLPSKLLDDYSRYVLSKGDITLALTRPILNSKLKVCIIDDFFEGSLLNQRVGKVITKDNAHKKFIYYLIQTEGNIRYLENMIAGTDPPNLSNSDLLMREYSVPSKEEQEKIASFFSLIDDKISLQGEKVEALKDYKKGMMQKIFSRELRFKDDDGRDYPEWEEKKLGDIIDKGKAGGTPKSTVKDYYNGSINFLSISDMTTQGKYINYTEKTITDLGLQNSSAWLIPKNSLIYSMYASVGFVSINKIELATSQAMFSMIINESTNIDYIYQYLSYFKDNGIEAFIETGTQGNLNANTVKNISIPYPTRDEQNKIASCVSSIESKIEKEQEKLDSLNEYKKGLLQQMFV